MFNRTFVCRYCYQVPEEFHVCTAEYDCKSTSTERVMAECVVRDDLLCLGTRGCVGE